MATGASRVAAHPARLRAQRCRGCGKLGTHEYRYTQIVEAPITREAAPARYYECPACGETWPLFVEGPRVGVFRTEDLLRVLARAPEAR